MSKLRAASIDRPYRSEPFFVTLSRLAARRHAEDQLSRCFVATFNASPAFRRATLELLGGRCRVTSRDRAAMDWRSSTQVSTRVARRKGRLDIVLQRTSSSVRRGAVRRIIIESKIGAPLTEEQLHEYRHAHGRTPLVALTARHPEINHEWFDEHRIVAVRWHEIDRVVHSAGGDALDRFLATSFHEYLEDLGMAHRPISRTDLNDIATTFRAIVKPGSRKRGVSFGRIEDLLRLLEDVERVVAERTDHAGVTSWTPRYYNWDTSDDPDNPCRNHYLGFNLRSRGRSKHPRSVRLEIAFIFPHDESESVKFQVLGWDNVAKQCIDDWAPGIGRLLDRSGHLDQDRIADAVVAGARALWGR